MRYSKQRDLILDIVRSNAVHPTAEWVYEQARIQMPSLGIATVYRNLHQLVSAGMIRRIAGLDGAERYDGNVEEHYHLRCKKCGRLFDLKTKDSQTASQIDKRVKELFCLTAAEVSVSTSLLEGLCADCSKESMKTED